MAELPSGTVAYLMTDVVGSTKLWERNRDRMSIAVVTLDELCERVAADHRGTLVKSRGEGDSHFFVFKKASEAASAAGALQAALADPNRECGLSVRAAIHVGEVDVRGEDYYGPVVNRCARLRAIAHGGQTLVSDGAQGLFAHNLPEGWSLTDLGVHLLKDLLQPERVWQLVGPGQKTEFPPIASLNARLRNVPVQLTSLVGRESEQEDILALLKSHRLVTIAGTGGCGKTRIAIQLAADLAESQIDGATWVDLTSTRDGGVAAAVLAAIGLPESGSSSPMEAIAKHVATESMALIVDNCEHVLTNARSVVGELLRSCSNLLVLATSREPLLIGGEQIYRLPSLSVPEDSGSTTAATLDEFSACRLFVDRATAQDPQFRPTDEDACTIATLCSLLDGIPLAIEQAASRSATLSPKQTLSSLGHRLVALRSGFGDSPPRHMTMRATIDWSYELLSEEERRFFARLSVFVGGWTLDAATAVVGFGIDVPDATHSLVTKSVVHSVAGRSADRRYYLLESFRQYASERFGEGQPEVASSHLDYYISLAERTEAALLGSEQATASDTLNADKGNLDAALALGESRRDSRQPSFVLALRNFWFRRGYLSEGRGWLERACDGWSRSMDRRTCGRMHNAIGVFAWKQGEFDTAETHLNDALKIWTALGDERQLATTYLNLGIISSDRGNLQDAEDSIRRSLSLQESLGDNVGRGTALFNLGTVQDHSGDSRAIETLKESRDILARDGDLARVAAADVGIASALVDRGSPIDAVRHLERSFGTWRTLVDAATLGSGLLQLSCVCRALNQTAQAVTLAGAASKIWIRTRSDPHPRNRQKLESVRSDADLALGIGEVQRLWDLGSAMTLEESVEFSLDRCHEILELADAPAPN